MKKIVKTTKKVVAPKRLDSDALQNVAGGVYTDPNRPLGRRPKLGIIEEEHVEL